MRVLIAPDRFSLAVCAADAADCLARGWQQVSPQDERDLLPLSDGGPGLLDVLAATVAVEPELVMAPGPYGEDVPARILLAGDTAYLEAAEVVGRHLVGPDPDPLAGSSAGVARLLETAAEAGVRRVVVGVGGTGITDGGRGLVDALGGVEAGRRRLAGLEVVAATATDAPLLGHSGAAHGFAAAKGADRAAREELEARLRAWATETDGGLAVRPGAGAGGGLGFGLLLLGAQRVNGAAFVAELVGLDERARAADLVLTAVGHLDWELLRGRVPVAVARAGQSAGRPVVALAAAVAVGRRELAAVGVDAAYALTDEPEPDLAAVTTEDLTNLAARVARSWSRS